jgi:hypothetical protein
MSSRRLGNRSGMTLKTLRVQCLTLAPSAPPTAKNGNKEECEDGNILDWEKMARAVEITVTTGAFAAAGGLHPWRRTEIVVLFLDYGSRR